MLSAAVISLYLWTSFAENSGVSKSLTVSLPTVVIAGLTALFCLISYIKIPKKNFFLVEFIIYLLVTATAIALIASTGTTSSPFVALWMLICAFSGIFGFLGLLPILATDVVFIAIQFINNNLTNEVIIIVLFSSLLPIIASLIMWRSKSTKDELNNDNRAYRNLANELSEVASKSEVVINAIGDGVIAIDNQGIIQLINPAAQSIIGWGKQDALALNYKSVLHLVNQKDEVLDASNDPIQQALNINQQIRTNNLALMTKSSKKIMISLVVSPVSEIGSGVIAVFHDVTKEKAEEREQAEFISTASHEMRTPVASIEGYMGLALNPQTAQVDDRARDFILKAHASAEHLGRLFQDLLDVSKADDGRIPNNPKVVDIVTFLHEIVQGLEQKATEKGLRLVYKPMPNDTKERHIAPVYSVNLDNDHIREIMNNLIENAIKYTPTGEVMVDISGNDDHVVISVKDSGIGIPVEDMSHLFQKFYRVDNKNTREIGGTGLGLYLCRRLSEIMGGRIWAESVYGSGSTFYLELPRVSSKDATMLIEQAAFKAQQEASRMLTPQPQPDPVSPFQTMQPVIQPAHIAAIPTPTPTPAPAPAAAPKITQPSQPVQQPPSLATPTTPARAVPRSQSLTPEQIAAYVAQQRALAMQQAAPQLGVRPQSVTVPSRELRQ